MLAPRERKMPQGERVAKQHTLLVVEDDHDLRTLTLELLRDEGYAAVGARNGREAVALLNGGLGPACVLLDLCLPVMSGPELLEWMRAHPRVGAVPVLIVSCKARALVPSLQHDVQGWIVKPPSPSELLATVERLCAGGRSVGGRRSSGSAFRAAI